MSSKKSKSKNPIKISRALQLSLVVMALFLGVIYLTVNSTLQLQNSKSDAAGVVTSTVTLTPVADTYVAGSSPSTQNSTSKSLRIKGTTQSIAFLKFNLEVLPAGSTITNAVLQLHTNTESDSNSINSYPITLIPDTTWTDKITWKTKPSLTGTSVGSATAPKVNTAYSYSLTPAPLQAYIGKAIAFTVGDPTFTLNDGMWFYSNEGSSKPQLVVTYSTGTAPTVTTVPSSSPQPSTILTPAPTSVTPTGTSGQTLGCGGIQTPAPGSNVVLTTTDSTAALKITSGGTASSPKIYDGGCHTVGTVTINANYVVVQNFKVVATGQYGFDSEGTGITMQNNDIKNVHPSGDGDLNAITFFGNNTKILYNTAINFVTGDPGTSHTDAVQTWVSTSHPTASANVTIQGNEFVGPANPSRLNSIASIHQCVMAEGLNDGGNKGGNGDPNNWLIADNYFSDSWNQCIKLDGVDNVSITRNTFAGSSDYVVEIDAPSSNVKFYSDNTVTGTYKKGINYPVTQGSGPTSL